MLMPHMLQEAIEAEKKAIDDLKNMKDLHKEGKASSEAVRDAEANLAMATINVGTVTVAATAAVIGTGTTSIVDGMYASGGVSYDTEKLSISDFFHYREIFC
jgi:filamentous hemagglutinin